VNAERLQNLILYKYRYLFAYISMIAIAVSALTYKLGSLVPGVSSQEVDQGLAIVNDSTAILEEGAYLPYNILQTLSIEVLGSTTLALRLPSIVFGALTLAMLFALVHLWHKERIAIVSIIFLATSSWFLTFARIGTPQIYIAFCIALVFLSGTLLRHAEHRRISLIFTAIALPLTLYAPLMIYILTLYVVLYRKEIKSISSRMSSSNIVVVTIFGTATILPLIYGLVSTPENIKVWLGVGDGLPSIGEYSKNILAAIKHILWRSNENPTLHLGDIAMLDIFTSTMAALGLYHYERHFKWLRTRFIIYGLGVLLLTFGLSTDEGQYFAAAPIIYILAATGLITLLNQWNQIFPINPFARTLALLPLFVALLFTSQYHLDRYFSAWALSPQVRRAYAAEPTLLDQHIGSSTKKTLIIANSSEHKALAFLISDNDISYDIVTPSEALQQSQLEERFDTVYLDGRVTGELKSKLDVFVSTQINSDRESRPVSYRVYDLGAQVGLSHDF